MEALIEKLKGPFGNLKMASLPTSEPGDTFQRTHTEEVILGSDKEEEAAAIVGAGVSERTAESRDMTGSEPESHGAAYSEEERPPEPPLSAP